MRRLGFVLWLCACAAALLVDAYPPADLRPELAALLQQRQPLPIPPYAGDGNPQHDGQPEWCQRESNHYKANCEKCERTCDEGEESEDSRCETNCRKGTCQCHPPCQT